MSQPQQESTDQATAKMSQQQQESTDPATAVEGQEGSSTLQSINNVGLLIQKDVVPLKDLQVGRLYPFVEVRPVETQHGRSIVVELEEFQVYLPKRFSTMSEHNIALLNADVDELYFVCMGPKEVKNGNPTHLVEFRMRETVVVDE